ncbi:WD40-repeat-containing domain protein [Gilbertella persicaria]|uniref:WD40-repeat-containing domain protein n=1 Tax=Gilbertella persicaria TaxID=101096 RepID=UPI00221E476B|nr:WD40-repeat-containing domain protein [Gilbertella persicaria]KAI8080700.1 WD40-repeat-containing domain protein [Gilbertella persicaria]
MSTSSNTKDNNRIIPLTCSGHTRPVVDIQFSPVTPDGNYYLISACKDGNPMLRDGATGDWIGTFQGHKGAVWSARLSRDSERAVTGSADFSAKVWDTRQGQVLHSFVHDHIVRAADFNADNTKILTGGKEQKLRIFDLYRPDAPAMELLGHEGTIKAVVWDESRHAVLSAGEDATVRIWDLRTMRQSGTIQTCSDAISTMTLSADGQYLTWAAGKTANFWQPDSPVEDVKTIVTQEKTSSISLHPNHEKFVAGSDEDLWVRIYDFHTGDVSEVYKGHHGPIHTVSYSPDGEIYATGSEDGTIRLWQTDPTKPYGLWQRNQAEIGA